MHCRTVLLLVVHPSNETVGSETSTFLLKPRRQLQTLDRRVCYNRTCVVAAGQYSAVMATNMIDFQALKAQLKLLGHELPDEQVAAILKDMNIQYVGAGA